MTRIFIVLTAGIMLAFSYTPTYAEGDKHTEHGFYKAAEEYAAEAEKYRAKGMDSMAKDYERLAEIKQSAGKLADQGKWDQISWDEYKKIEARIHKDQEKHKNHKDKHK